MDVAWTKFLRKSSQAPSHRKAPLRCPLCSHDIVEPTPTPTTTTTTAATVANAPNAPNVLNGFSIFEKHVADAHASDIDEKASSEARNSWLLSLWKTAERNARRGAPAGAAADGPHSNGSLPRHPPRDTATTDAQPSQISEGTGARAEVETPGSPIPSVNSLKRTEGTEWNANAQSPSKRARAHPSPSPPPVANPNDARADLDRVDRALPHKGRLWTPDDDATSPRPQSRERCTAAPPNNRRSRGLAHKLRSQRQLQAAHKRSPAADHEDLRPIKLIRQPETKVISQEQLVAEVKGIYAGLVIVENKCIEVDSAQSRGGESAKPLNNSQWQALVTLHRTLLNEHHDFFLASQHPSASPALRKLSSKYSMPARMWRHGIHSFLELLRHRLPGSLEHMLLFIYVAYAMIALLYETVTAFEDTWIECLGDLARYRMAIEDDDVRDRENWTCVSRGWYSKASDKAPTIGRLYHHLAILSRPHALRQQFNYAKSLCVPVPFASTCESILTLYEPVLAADAKTKSKFEPSDFAFIRCHAILFTKRRLDEFEATMDEFVGLLGGELSRRSWQEPGYYIGITLCCSILGYGANENSVFQAIKPAPAPSELDTKSPKTSSRSAEKPADDIVKAIPVEQSQERAKDDADDLAGLATKCRDHALALAKKTHDIVLRRPEDASVIPYLHVNLVFMLHLIGFPSAIAKVAPEFPWKLVAKRLNRFLADAPALAQASFKKSFLSVVEGEGFPHLPEKEDVLPVPLPEDYALRGLIWALDYFPAAWFSNGSIEDEERLFEPPSLEGVRKERAVWTGCRIAARGQGKWLTYDQEAHRFGVAPEWDVEVGDLPPAVSDAAASTNTKTTSSVVIPSTAATRADSNDLGTLPDASVEASVEST